MKKKLNAAVIPIQVIYKVSEFLNYKVTMLQSYEVTKLELDKMIVL